jgi:RimJ/RimL family protein N-acetyltransferase
MISTVPVDGSPAGVRAYIRRQNGRLDEGAGYSFAIADAQTDDAVGQIGLWTGLLLTSGRASIGYWIGPAFRRRGYAGAAIRLIADWASTLSQVKRLELYVELWNEGSWRAAESAGFVREGVVRSWQQVGDHRRDMYMYSRIPNVDGDAAGS